MSVRVVIVDDDDDIRELLVLSLELLGNVQVVGEAGTLELAREVLLATKPDVAVLDIGLPDGSGADLIGFPSSSPPAAVVLSAQVSGDHEALYAKGAASVLDKPCPPADLVAEILRVSPPPASS